MTNDTGPQAKVEQRPYVCCGCGKPYLEGAYKDCDCATTCGFLREDRQDIIVAKPRCAWCGTFPIRAELDGDPLCQSCCNKWVYGEGIADQEKDYVD